MIQITNGDKILNVTNVVNEMTPSFSGIVNQECKGNLWLDQIEVPRIAIAESYAVGGFAFLGIYESEEEFLGLKDFLEKDFFPKLKEDGYDCFEFTVESNSMHNGIMKIFKEKDIQSEKEFFFRTGTVPDRKPNIPMGYEIRKVDALFWDMLLQSNFENEDFLKIRLLESWHSFEEFAASAIAYCVVFENRIVSVMVGTASFHHIIAIDIETEEKHQCKGLAYALAVEFITDCLEHDYIPQWNCVESNDESIRMAGKLGFHKINQNTVYWFEL